MREQVSHLQASLRSAQGGDGQTPGRSGSVGVDKETNTDVGGADRASEKLVRDVAVATEAVGGAAAGPEQPQVSANGLLATLRRMEAIVSGALETADQVKQSEQRVSQVTERMESIAQRVEEALGRAADTEEQLDLLLESRITQQDNPQSPGHLSADPGTCAACLTEDGDGTESPPPPSKEVSQPLPMNGGSGQGSCTEVRLFYFCSTAAHKR
ncbi:uncharacterized protein LOC142885733 [Nelusetta ayraudi]|uniref:uncharacterized protein LOC142885733 n=1 Tax=Nelusetta ayraudi TaxID=303726 RepID=UPI003F6F9AD7